MFLILNMLLITTFPKLPKIIFTEWAELPEQEQRVLLYPLLLIVIEKNGMLLRDY